MVGETTEMICERLSTCAFVEYMIKIVPFTVNMMKIKYCKYDKNRCARYRLSKVLQVMEIPDDLWPGDDIKALEIIEKKFNGNT
jgi:hypothetical protein